MRRPVKQDAVVGQVEGAQETTDRAFLSPCACDGQFQSMPRPRSSARALMEAIGRLSFTVINVRLSPACNIERKRLSSSSDHTRCDIIGRTSSLPLRPMRQAKFRISKESSSTFLSTARWVSVEARALRLPPDGEISLSACISIRLRKCNGVPGRWHNSSVRETRIDRVVYDRRSIDSRPGHVP